MERESSRSIIDDLHCWDIQRDQSAGESGVTRSIMMKLILWISNEIKLKVKLVLSEVSLMNFIVGISK